MGRRQLAHRSVLRLQFILMAMIVCHPFEPLAPRQVNPILHTGSLAQCEEHQYILEPVQYYFYHLIPAYMPIICLQFACHSTVIQCGPIWYL